MELREVDWRIDGVLGTKLAGGMEDGISGS
jgi:hypothetical protein